MELILIRKQYEFDYTAGELFIKTDGVLTFLCHTLEDPHRKVKVPGDTCIPEGLYPVELMMSPHFKRVLPRFSNVPNFAAILFHRGNTVKDTRGCVLVGQERVGGTLRDSTDAEIALVALFKRLGGRGTVRVE